MTNEEIAQYIKSELANDDTEIYLDADDYKIIVKALEQEPRWIPVEGRLPDIHSYSEKYLVTLKRGGIYIAMFTECDGKHWWTYDDVVAWMPLPREYREVEENGD